MVNPLIRKIPKMTGRGTGGHKSAGILDDHAVRKNIATKEGTIEHVPTEENHITNKDYVDSQIRGNIELFLTEDASDIGTYFDLATDSTGNPEETTTQAITANSTTLIASYASILNEDEIENITDLELGIYSAHLHASANFPNGMTIYFEFYRRTSGGVETLLATSHDSNILSTSEAQIELHSTVTTDLIWNTGDRVVVKVYGRNINAASKNITIFVEGDTLARVEFPAFIPPAEAGFWNRTGTVLSPKTAGDDIATTGQINLGSVGANIITATNAGGDLRLGAGGGTNDLKINTDGKIDIFEELDMNTKKIVGVVDPTANQEAATKKYVDDNAGGNPAGTILMYGNTTAPTGYVNCDGASLLRAGTYAALFAVISTTYGTVDGTHFNVPDMRGAFPRGQGTSTQFTQDHATTLGTYEDDSMQGHKHDVVIPNHSHISFYYFGFLGGAGNLEGSQTSTAVNASIPSNLAGGGTFASAVPKTDSTNGTPRTANETRPNNLGVNFIIKF